MMLCKDCVHYEVCKDYVESALDGLQYNDSQMNGDDCEFFKDRSRFVELDKEADSGRVITLDDAIAHCYEVADGADDSMCNGCRAEHMMLAAWLCELKMRREQELQKPLGIGDEVWCVLEDLDDLSLADYEITVGDRAVCNEPQVVTEVGERGFWIDAAGAEFDLCHNEFYRWDELGEGVFTSREAAEQALKEREKTSGG